MIDVADLTAVNRPSMQRDRRKHGLRSDLMDTAKRSALTGASVQVVAKCGFHGALVSTIASRAGVAPATLSVHFESKEHLLLKTFKVLERRW